MILISIVMVLAFTSIYLITYGNIQKQNHLKLENTSAATLGFMEMTKDESEVSVQSASSEYFETFGIVINESKEYIFDSSFGLLSKDFVNDIIQEVYKKDADSGKINFSEKEFQYLISLVSAKVEVSDSFSGEVPVVQQLYQISFLDTSQSKRTLTQLLITFLIIGLLTLAAIFIVSVYFAKSAVTPIEQSYNKQKQFIQDASHELKTPLASIHANLDVVLENSAETVESQNKWLGFISGEIDRMTKLVNDLLLLAKSEYTEAITQLSPVNFSEITETAVASIEAILFEKGIRLNEDIDTNIVVNGDKDKLTQIIKILFDNAVKYVNDGGYIDVILSTKKSKAYLYVVNTGMGIPSDQVSKIFDRFYRVNNARLHDGSYGLGLSIAKSLVESMKGDISVSSNVNEKTTFTVMFHQV